MTEPFRCESSDVNQLDALQLTQLLKSLLHSEAYKFGIAQHRVNVALNINVSDGGEDGRIEWIGGVSETDYLPQRLTMFQNKASDMYPSAYADEITDTCGELKKKVEDTFEQGGAYIVFTTQELNTKQIEARVSALRVKLTDLQKPYANNCVIDIYDAAKISSWANCFISTITAVLSWAGRPLERGLKAYKQWAEFESLSSLPFVTVGSRQGFVETVSDKVTESKACLRVIGLSGLGKTRTVFEVFKGDAFLQNRVIYVDANHAPRIDALVSDWVGLNLEAIIVVDNCEYLLHNRLVKEVTRTNSKLSLLTLDYNLDSVATTTSTYQLKRMEDEEIFQLLTPVYKDRLPDLHRICNFAQGFPQMAVLLAEARLSDDPRIGELTEDELANKLLWKSGEKPKPEYLKVLQACSLFDVFGIEKELEPQLQFISDTTGVDMDTFFECVQEYSDKGIINRQGRFGQVVPKPLAIRLAGQWWSKSREVKQLDLIDTLPGDMVEGFCTQIEKMDFHTDVKQISEKLCGPQGPFGQAEVIFSVQGSRLFRALIEINPTSTSRALYRVLSVLSDDQVRLIEGNVRRNLVWGLEELCFNALTFTESSWCMLLLAAAENERWSNNASGMFARLYRIQGSRTESLPCLRLAVIERAFELNRIKIDLVLIEALNQAISTQNVTRKGHSKGVAYRKREWQPNIWQEIFDYWQASFDLLIQAFDKGPIQKEAVLLVIGKAIRSLVGKGRIEMLDVAIKRVVSIHGRDWPSAVNSLTQILKYDSAHLTPEALKTIQGWLELFSPPIDSSLEERLKLIVVSPAGEGLIRRDGHYVNVGEEKAVELAAIVANDVKQLVPKLSFLLEGEQKQTFPFGEQLAKSISIDNAKSLLSSSLEVYLKVRSPNADLILGILSGIYQSSQEEWQVSIDDYSDNKQFSFMYVFFIQTGSIKNYHLNKLLRLIEKEEVLVSDLRTLAYGGVTKEIAPFDIMSFCSSLSVLGRESSWSALNIIYMYCFSDQDKFEVLKDNLKSFIVTIPLSKDDSEKAIDGYVWHDLVRKLLDERDTNFASALTEQLIAACEIGLSYNDLWNFYKPLLLDIAEEYEKVVWPKISQHLVQSKGEKLHWIQKLLERENSFSNQSPSVLSAIPVIKVMSWCERYPDFGPVFVASTINLIKKDAGRPSALFIALLENNGDEERVQRSIEANMNTRGWSGSLVPFLKAEKHIFEKLLSNKNLKVQVWIQNYLTKVDCQIESEIMSDEERSINQF